MERKRVLVAFGDIRGFRKWTLRAINAQEVAEAVLGRVYDHFEAYAREKNIYVKFLGDGLMAVQELRDGHNCGVVREFLHGLRDLTTVVLGALLGVYPRPDGFRVRVASGHVWKRMTLQKRRGKTYVFPEYIGYAVNMAQALLYVYPEIECICHESVVEIMGKKTNGLSLEHLPQPEERRHGIDMQDFAGLWRFGDKKTDSKNS